MNIKEIDSVLHCLVLKSNHINYEFFKKIVKSFFKKVSKEEKKNLKRIEKNEKDGYLNDEDD